MVSICTTLARDWGITDFIQMLVIQSVKDFEWVCVDFMYEQHKKSYSKICEQNNIKLVHIPNDRRDNRYMRDIARNRNKALVHAQGDVIIFLDDFVQIENDFIEQHLKGLEKYDISCGHMSYMQKDMYISTDTSLRYASITIEHCTQDSRHDLLFTNPDMYPQLCPVLGSEWTYTGNLAIKQEVVEKLNGFDPRLTAGGEDGDFGLRAAGLGFSIGYNPLASSLNLCTKSYPCFNPFDHEHAVTFLQQNKDLIIKNPEVLEQYNMQLVWSNKQPIVLCTICEAEYLLDPIILIYKKLHEQKEYITLLHLFNLKEEKERLQC